MTRVREARVTPKGKAMTDLVDAAREKLGRQIFSTWKKRDIDAFVRLMRRFANALNRDNAPWR
jgi:DNA-binding MarR family transcriptional regulator